MCSKKIGLIAALLLTPALYCQQSQLLELVNKQSVDLSQHLNDTHTRYAHAMKTQLPQDLLRAANMFEEYQIQLFHQLGHAASIRSELYLYLGQYESARKAAHQTLELSSSQQDKARALITLATTSKDPSKKEFLLNRVLSYNDAPFAQSTVQTHFGNKKYAEGNYALAKAYYEKALSHEHVPPEYLSIARLNLGAIYFNGLLESPDYAKSAKYFTDIINNGTPKNFLVRTAHYILGKIYFYGEHGVSQDLAKAKEHFEIIANSKHASKDEKTRSLAKIEAIRRLLQKKEFAVQSAPAA